MEKDDSRFGITLHPDFEKLGAEVDRLRTVLSMLVLERDELIYHECKNIEMAYMLCVGGLEYKAYMLWCSVLRLKRKAEPIQAKKNRQEKIDLSEIESILYDEILRYRLNIEEQLERMNAALERSHKKELTEAEVSELKKLYRGVVKALHPDLNPGLGAQEIRLFQNAVEAYEHGDLNGLRMIEAMLGTQANPDEKIDVFEALAKEKERLTRLIGEINDAIAEIKSRYPYTMKAFVQNPKKIEARKAEIEAEIKRLNETLAAYRKRIKELAGE